ncbi:DUF4174 domain-containing protein [Negadavirga shengliensis]|uniref:DUF4174 domain-containing protein n=1 Tax=Negadavirga shengliensis TaxID=1389218 RepID=A0ABV9T4F9_9BACT
MKSIFTYLIISALFFSNTFITLDDLQWKKRVLLCFVSPTDDTPFVLDVNDSIEYEMKERDLVYFVIADTITTNSGSVFNEEYAEEIRKVYSLGAKSHCWVLLGKDGGLKLRKEGETPDWHELFATIDIMPTRQKEIRKKQEGDI